MEVADILEKAAELIEPEGAWTQGEYARGKSGLPVKVSSPAAVCWCVSGALLKVSSGRLHFKTDKALRDLVPARAMVAWNDAPGRTQAEVVAKLREAAAKARQP